MYVLLMKEKESV
ncbi:Protein of unknown function [Bacillus wiedmannii]|nr:Protein of unknown function [Bacillus wiedmannii]